MQWAADNWILFLLIGGMLGMHFFGHRGHGARKVQAEGDDGSGTGENIGGTGGGGGGGCCGGKSHGKTSTSGGGGGCCGGKSKAAEPMEDDDVPMIVKREAPLA